LVGWAVSVFGLVHNLKKEIVIMRGKIVWFVLMISVLGLVECSGSSSSSNNTASNFVGTWKGSTLYSGTMLPTTLILYSSLTGSYLIPAAPLTYNLATPCVVSNGTLSFSLPLSIEDATSGCAAWAISCAGTLSNVKTTLSLTCSGLLCDGMQYSYTDVMTKQ